MVIDVSDDGVFDFKVVKARAITNERRPVGSMVLHHRSHDGEKVRLGGGLKTSNSWANERSIGVYGCCCCSTKRFGCGAAFCLVELEQSQEAMV